jgi:hypothetical protein
MAKESLLSKCKTKRKSYINAKNLFTMQGIDAIIGYYVENTRLCFIESTEPPYYIWIKKVVNEPQKDQINIRQSKQSISILEVEKPRYKIRRY